jgi:hypothetical protein
VYRVAPAEGVPTRVTVGVGAASPV